MAMPGERGGHLPGPIYVWLPAKISYYTRISQCAHTVPLNPYKPTESLILF